MEINEFSKKQAEILKFAYSNEETLICDGAVRSGKTIVMALAFVLWAMNSFDRTNFAVCGKTVSNAERNILRPFEQIEGMPFTLSYKMSNRMLTVRCGKKENYFYLFGGKDESSYALIQGLTLAGVLFDEVALMPQSFVDQAIARTLSYKNAKIWFNCNPESPNHWFYREWLSNKNKKHKHLHFLMSDNPTLGKEEIERAEALFSGVFYERYILGQWVIAEGLVYPMFDKKRHVTDECTEPQGEYFEYYISIDYGTINPCSMGLWRLDRDKAIRVQEVYFDSKKKKLQATDEEYYTMLEKLAGDKLISCVIVDPSAASFIETIRRHGKFNVHKANNEVLDGIRVTGTLLQNNKILIHSSCENSIREFGIYRWDEKAAEDRVIKEFDHAMDDIRYFCNTILKKRLM